MRYENLEFQDDILPIIRRHDGRSKSIYNMYMHWHNAVEILLIKEGKMRITSGQEHVDVHAGQIVCIHAGHLHLYDPITDYCRYYCIIFPAKALDGDKLYYRNLPRTTEDPQAIEWMEQLMAVVKAKADFWQERGKAILTLMYLRLTELGGNVSYGDFSRLTTLTKSAMDYIDQHFQQPSLCLEEIAEQLHISPYHLSHLFKKVTGHSISAYWQAQRLDLARRLLANGSSVAEAAEKSGFTSQSYFCRAYQKHFGILPSKQKT